MNLVRLVKKFLRLETMAVLLYSHHEACVAPELRPMMHEFTKIEETHRLAFARLYTQLTSKPAPRLRFTCAFTKRLALFLERLGVRAMLKFECEFEARAVQDYTKALQLIKDPRAKTVVESILKDELSHKSFDELLHIFREHEERHISKMENELKRLA